MTLGFSLVVALAVGAAYVGYQGSQSIHENAQELVRKHLVASGRGAELELLIERESQALLDELVWILGLCTVLAIACAGLTIGVINRAFAKLEWQSKELQRVSWHMLESHERIARRFSHEMHDELGQALTGLKSMLKRSSGENFTERRAEFVEVLDESLQSVRELSQMLRPVVLDDFGLDAALRWLVERFSQRTGIPVSYHSTVSRRLSERLETHLFRITQEALTNIARHAEASRARVLLDEEENGIRLEIEDNGKGFAGEENQHPSLGMVGMRARARQVDGELTLLRGELGGLLVQVTAPAAGPSERKDEEDTDLIS
jgi:signal transduction histidine kinase